jgi:DNA polymerase elongation subunit (family B)
MENASYFVDGKTNKPIILLFSRSWNNKFETVTHRVENFVPYMYAPANETNIELPPNCYYDSESVLDAKGREVVKVFVDIPNRVRDIRDNYSFTDMSDFLFEKRFLVDYKIKYAYTWDGQRPYPVEVEGILEPRILFYDIENLSRDGKFPDASNAVYPTCMIQVGDSYTEDNYLFTCCGIPQTKFKGHIACHNEHEMFKTFLEYIKMINPDLIVGWFSSGYDLPYLIKRAVNIGTRLNGFSRIKMPFRNFDPKKNKWMCKASGRSILDMRDAFKKKTAVEAQRESYALKSIAASFGFTYRDYGPTIHKLFENEDWETLLQYGLNDVLALRLIEKKSGLYSFYESLRKFTGCFMDDVIHTSIPIESMLLHRGIRAMPRKATFNEDDKSKFKGAVVHKPPVGIHHRTISLDIAALYPNVLYGYSLSPDIDGLVAIVAKEILDERERLRTMRKANPDNINIYYEETSVKVVANALYGNLGSKAFRLYDESKAAEVTKRGREINLMLKAEVERLGYKVLTGDSICGKSKLKVYDSTGEWKYINIEDLFINVDTTSDDGKEYCILNDVYVESINNDGKIVLDRIKCVMRHKSKKEIYRIRNSNSKYIDVTEDHSICVYNNKKYDKYADQKDRIVSCKSSEIGVKYKSVIIKRKSIHNKIISKNYDKRLYEYMGYHLGDGTLKFYNYKKNNGEISNYIKGISISFCGHKKEFQNYFVEFLIRSNYISGIGKYSKNDRYEFTGSSKFAKFIFENIGHKHNKTVPEFMFYESDENICSFIRGLFSADGTVLFRNNRPILRLTSIIENVVKDVSELLLNVGIVSNYFKENSENNYNGRKSGTFSYHLIISDIQKFIDKIGFLQSLQNEKLISKGIFQHKVDSELDWSFSSTTSKSEKLGVIDDYVYDLTTVNTHKFFANNILCLNTDSLFINEVKTIEEGLSLEKHFNEFLEKFSIESGSRVIFKLKFEKYFDTLMFKFKKNGDAAKKKYMGKLIWEEGKHKEVFHDTGTELTRSDSSRITKEILGTFLDYVLMKDDIEGARKYIKESYENIKNGKNVDIYDISIPKEVRSVMKTDGTKNKSPWISGKENSITYFNHYINEGEKPRLIYVTKEPYVFCIDEDLDIGEWKNFIDWKMVLEKTVTDKLRTYTDAAGINWDEVIHGQTNLMNFM